MIKNQHVVPPSILAYFLALPDAVVFWTLVSTVVVALVAMTNGVLAFP